MVFLDIDMGDDSIDMVFLDIDRYGISCHSALATTLTVVVLPPDTTS
jgi:hypothetical protein